MDGNVVTNKMILSKHQRKPKDHFLDGGVVSYRTSLRLIIFVGCRRTVKPSSLGKVIYLLNTDIIFKGDGDLGRKKKEGKYVVNLKISIKPPRPIFPLTERRWYVNRGKWMKNSQYEDQREKNNKNPNRFFFYASDTHIRDWRWSPHQGMDRRRSVMLLYDRVSVFRKHITRYAHITGVLVFFYFFF